MTSQYSILTETLSTNQVSILHDIIIDLVSSGKKIYVWKENASSGKENACNFTIVIK